MTLRPAAKDSLLICVMWMAACAWTIWYHWLRIQTITFPDPDDAMRMKQVLDLVAGQSWWDLRQHGVDPPGGTDMHWSRLVDLPLLAILRPTLGALGRDGAMRVAGTLAPLIAMLPAMQAAGLAARRLIDPRAGVLAAATLWLAPGPSQMWDPMRVDHHGWQIALACAILASLVGRRDVRSGMLAAAACCASLSIGMEAMPIVAVAAAAVVVRWIATGDGREARAFAVATMFLLPAGYGLFAPYGNARLLCDALTPVWTGDGVLAGTLLLVATFAPGSVRARIAAAAAVAAGTVLFHTLHSPGCFAPTEHISPLARRLWFGTNRETMPLFSLDASLILLTLWHAGVSSWGVRAGLRGPASRRWIVPAALLCVTFATTLWRMRGGPLAQAMGNPGVALVAWKAVAAARGLSPAPRRWIAWATSACLASGNAVVLADGAARTFDPMTPQQVAFYECTEGTRLELLRHAAGRAILADLYQSPRITLMSGHPTLAGPYHRDADAVVALLRDWQEPPATARAETLRHGVDIVVACPAGEPSMGKDSFHDKLIAGAVPWAHPLRIPGLAPIAAWRVDRH